MWARALKMIREPSSRLRKFKNLGFGITFTGRQIIGLLGLPHVSTRLGGDMFTAEGERTDRPF